MDFDRIIEIDRKIAELEKQQEELKTQINILLIDRERRANEVLEMMSEVNSVEIDGIVWKKQKGRESVVLKTENVPVEFCTLSPDKRLILKTSRKNPEAIAAFAEIVRAPDKLVYKVV